MNTYQLTVSPKGQVTLPKTIRDQLGLRPGDEVIFSILGSQLVLTPKSTDFNDLAGFLGVPPNGPATLDQIAESIEKAGAEAAISGLRPNSESKAA